MHFLIPFSFLSVLGRRCLGSPFLDGITMYFLPYFYQYKGGGACAHRFWMGSQFTF